MRVPFLSAVLLLSAVAGHADGPEPMVEASDPSVANGIVSASRVVADANGWLVVHRTGADMTPGPVVAHAPLRRGKTADVAAILTEPVEAGDRLMLMVHSEAGGTRTGIFEYTLGATEDGPVRVDGDLVMTVVTVR